MTSREKLVREMLIQRLLLYQKAERDITQFGQTVEIEGMRITRANLADIRKEIRNLQADIMKIDATAKSRNRRRIRVVVPRD